MSRFLVKRLLMSILTLFLISVVTFGLFFLVPSNAAWLQCGKNCTPQRIAQVEKTLGLDRPITEQYANYMKGIVTGRTFDDPGQQVRECPAPCLGFSFTRREPVTNILARGIPITLSIVGGAFVIYIAVGVGLGMLSALRKGTAFDRAAIAASLGFASTQIYTLGLLLLLIFVYTLKILPNPGYTPITENPFAWAGGLLMPWITLGLINSAAYARLSRAQMVETMSEDFVRTARAKGLPARKVYGRHALRAAITPIVTIAGIDLGTQLGGVAITESVFALNGIGRLAVQAVNDLNMPVVMATVLISAVFVVVANVVVDVLYAVIDPRVRLS